MLPVANCAHAEGTRPSARAKAAARTVLLVITESSKDKGHDGPIALPSLVDVRSTLPAPSLIDGHVADVEAPRSVKGKPGARQRGCAVGSANPLAPRGLREQACSTSGEPRFQKSEYIGGTAAAGRITMPQQATKTSKLVLG